MDTISLGLVLVIGLAFWGGWPLVAQASDIKDPLVRGFLVNAVTAIGFLPFLLGKMSGGVLNASGGSILIVAGLFNFAGHLLFPKLQTMAGSQVSIYMTMIPALVIAASAVGGPIFYADAVTIPKIFFTLIIVIGIIGLAYTSVSLN